MTIKRCWWCEGDTLYEQYHDQEWGIPVHDDRELFECLMLECFQAGLSWITVLKKRKRFREVFFNFEIERSAKMRNAKVEKLMQDAGIIRHRKKIESVRSNARVAIKIKEEHGSLDQYFWAYTEGKSLRTNPAPTKHSIPTTTPLAVALSKDLKKRGMLFVGPSIVYAFMQAVGLVNDHVKGCYRA